MLQCVKNFMFRHSKALLTLMFYGVIFQIHPVWAQTECIEVSLPSGIYPAGTVLSAKTNAENGDLKYTLDGSDPTLLSSIWPSEKTLGPDLLSRSKNHFIHNSASERSWHFDADVKRVVVIGFASFNPKTGLQQCPTSFYSYVLEEDVHEMPFLSLVGDEHDLFDFEEGILNAGILRDSLRAGNCDLRGSKHERQVNVMYMPVKGRSQSLKMGVRCHGGTARQTQQKGMRLKSGKEYGGGLLKLSMFGKDVALRECVLRPSSISYSGLGLEDHFSSFLAIIMGVDAARHQFVEVYINGIYHGVYSMQERINENWLKVNMKAKEPIIVSSWSDQTHADFVEMMVFLEGADLTKPTQFAYIDSVLDLNAFIRYQVVEQFIMNRDWPSGNVKFWRDADDPDSKWRPIFFDGDAGFFFVDFNPLKNALGESQCDRCRTTPKAGLLMRRLWSNPHFRNTFIEFSELTVNGKLSYEKTSAWSKILLKQMEPAHGEMVGRFNHTKHQDFESSRQWLDVFLKTQPERLLNALREVQSDVSFEWE